MFAVTEWARTRFHLLDSEKVNSLTPPPLHFERFLATSAACFFFSEMDAKLVELGRKCEELYEMSNKKYSDSVWKEKLWGQIDEELKKLL
jgi:hypothetical protein